MILPRMSLDGVTTLDSYRRGNAVEGPLGSYSPRPRSASESSNVDGILPSFHGSSAAAMPVDEGFVRRSVSMPLAGIVGGGEEDVDTTSRVEFEAWGARGEVFRYHSAGANATVPYRLQIGDCRLNGRQLIDPKQANRPTPKVTSMSVSHDGSSFAYGDNGGRLYLLGALPRTDITQKASSVGGAFLVQGDINRSKLESGALQRDPRHTRYKALCGATAYSAVIDPLNSVPVTPGVSSLSFVPREGPTSLLIATNEKVPKLFKVTNTYDTPQASFRAVDLLGTKLIGPLISTSRTHGHGLKLIHKYAMDHEYNVHSVSATMDGAYFYTSDALSLRLWSVENSDTSVEVVSLPKPVEEGGEESAREEIFRMRMFSNEPSLCFLSTSAGNVRVCDTRESLRWTNRLSHQVFSNPCRDMYDGKYASVTNGLTGGCALSSCGRYIAARDFFSVIMWDVRKAGSPDMHEIGGLGIDKSIVRRWELHPRMRRHIDNLYQNNVLFEKFGLDFTPSISSSSSGCIVTGGLGGTVFAIDPFSTADVAEEPYPDDEISVLTAAEASMKGVRSFSLPDVADLSSEQRSAAEEIRDPLQDPYFHSASYRSLRAQTEGQMRSEKVFEGDGRRIAHVLDSGVGGGGVWVSAGEFIYQLIV